MITISKRNESFLYVYGDQEDLLTIKESFTRFAPNFRFNPKYKSGRWDGKIRLFNSATNTLPSGLLNKLLEYIEEAQINYTISPEFQEELDEIDDFDEDLFQEVLDHFEETKVKKDIEQRNYQIEAAKVMLRMKRGQLHHATSSGKTFTTYLILSYLLRKNSNEQIMVVVPTLTLIHQFKSDFSDYGMDVEKLIGKFYAKEKDTTKPIVVGTWQSLQKAEEFIKKVTVVITDENHHAKAKNIKDLMERCINTPIRIGMSGSQHEDELDRLSVEGSFGPILSVVTSSELIEQGYISDIEIFQLMLEYPSQVRKDLKKLKKEKGGKKAYDEEKDIIQSSTRRRSLVKKLIEKRDSKENILLLFDELEYGESIFEELKISFPDRICYYIAGDVDSIEREVIRVNANNEEGVLVIASLGTFSTGVNLPKIHIGIFLWMGKSLVRLQQSIGRGLRKHATKDKFRLFDIVDDLIYSKPHGMKRLQFYIREGFSVSQHTIGLPKNNFV